MAEISFLPVSLRTDLGRLQLTLSLSFSLFLSLSLSLSLSVCLHIPLK
ncbi:MAG: hypothetical protein KTM48_00510 [Wolbachia endosymbiont of Pissodes strobi]|nr:hypothetical protein [Wolbachia endosymbiont of Pissodes strobi]